MADTVTRGQLAEMAGGIGPCASKTVTFSGVAQVETITLTGTSGTATVAVAGGLSKTATFTTNLTTSAANFVTSHAAAYAAVGIIVTSNGADIIMTAAVAGTPFTAPTITNATGDLAGSVVDTNANAAVLNSTGDQNGTGNPITLFTVTGTVLVRLFAICITDLQVVSGATLEVGTTISTAGLIAQTSATGIDANEIWHDATPDASIELSSVVAENIIHQDIHQLVGTADISGGSIAYYCIWKPISNDGSVVAA